MTWLITRFREASTWRGLIVLAGILGYSVKPEMQEYIVTIGTSAIALLEIMRKETPHANSATEQGTAGTGAATTGQTINSPELTSEQRQQYGLDS